MSKANLYRKDGTIAGSIDLNDKIFDAKVNQRLLQEVIRLYANNKRTGLSSTKTMAEVSGGGKKPWKQKGTGRARTSSIRNPLWRGGGTLFGPKPREIYYSISKGERSKAILSALSLKNKEGSLFVIEDAGIATPKTKEAYSILKALGLTDESVLCLVGEVDSVLDRAFRNISRLSIKGALQFNAYHVMRKKRLVVAKEVLPKLEERLKEVLDS